VGLCWRSGSIQAKGASRGARSCARLGPQLRACHGGVAPAGLYARSCSTKVGLRASHKELAQLQGIKARSCGDASHLQREGFAPASQARMGPSSGGPRTCESKVSQLRGKLANQRDPQSVGAAARECARSCEQHAICLIFLSLNSIF
jgi:hypothetical protein